MEEDDNSSVLFSPAFTASPIDSRASPPISLFIKSLASLLALSPWDSLKLNRFGLRNAFVQSLRFIFL